MVFFLVLLLCAAESQTDSSLHEKIAPYSTWVLSVGVHFHGCQENLANWQYLSQRAAEHQRNCSQSHPPDYFNTRSWIDIIKSLCHLLHFHCFVVAVVASVVVPKCSVALFFSSRFRCSYWHWVPALLLFWNNVGRHYWIQDFDSIFFVDCINSVIC